MNTRHSESFRNMFPNQSESILFHPKSQSDWIWVRFDKNRVSIWLNPNHSDLGFIWIESDRKLGLDEPELGFVQVDSDQLGMKLIWFQTTIKRLFGLVQNESDSPDWIPFRNYRQGYTSLSKSPRDFKSI